MLPTILIQPLLHPPAASEIGIRFVSVSSWKKFGISPAKNGEHDEKRRGKCWKMMGKWVQ